ncbi:MAG TPA: flagellar hook-associated protein FlgL, partial [Gemmatimonadales bacterium]|nr:flagellar hook-associated protein FlgL [Gemmatimonadales bacterium]
MRITNGILQQNALREIQRNLSELAEAQRQVATGRRHDRVSDDPLAGTQVVRHDAALRALEQHRRNATAVRARLDAEEAVLGQLDALLTRAKELGTEQASGGTGAVGRAAAVAELDRILEQVIQLGNTELGGEHLFGGYLVDAPPFDPTGAYLGDDGVRQAELGAGYVIDTVHSGRRIFVDTGVIASVRQLRGAVQGGDTAAIATALTAVDGA